MELFLIYLIKAACSVILFYLIYWMLLRRVTFFMLNRVYLLSVLVFSVVLPLSGFSILTCHSYTGYNVLLDTISTTASNARQTLNSSLSVVQIISVVYFTGLAIFASRFLLHLYRLIRLTNRFEITCRDGIRLIFTDSGFSPFSFFRFVFLSRDIDRNSVEKIIAHERVHINQRHSYDLIFAGLFSVFQWFNPVAWLISKSIREVHEYLADNGVLTIGHDRHLYQNLLLSVTMGGTISPLAINFNYSILKRRFIMMSKSKTGKAGMLKYLFVIPVILMLLFLLNIDKSDGFNGRSGLNLLPDTPDNNATITIYGTRDIKKNEHKTDITTYYPDSVVYSVVEKMPEFKGGNDALNKYILDNIIYPEEARKKGIEGTVYVSFIVNQKGKVTKVKLSKGVDLLLDAEAIRVIKSMPDWKPGRNKGEPVSVSYTVPIKFRLEKEKK